MELQRRSKASVWKGFALPVLVLLLAFGFLCLGLPVSGSEKPLPDPVLSAKTAFVANETGKPAVLQAAVDQLSKWNRLTLAPTREEADLVLVFSKHPGLDKWGNAGSIDMAVFLKGHTNPVFTAHHATKLTFVSHLPTRDCIDDLLRRIDSESAQTNPHQN